MEFLDLREKVDMLICERAELVLLKAIFKELVRLNDNLEVQHGRDIEKR